jgi:hypothetical protein
MHALAPDGSVGVMISAPFVAQGLKMVTRNFRK